MVVEVGSGTGKRMALGVLILKQTRTVQFAVAAIGMVNTGSEIPFFIVSMYRCVLSPRWILNLNYPFMRIEYVPSEKHALSAGLTVDNYGCRIRPEVPWLPRTVYYRRSLFKVDLNYYIRPAPGLKITAQSGWQFTQRGGIYTSNGRDQIYEIDGANDMYLHIGVNFTPSVKSRRVQR